MENSTHRIVISAVIAAIYAALTMFLAPISYGALQFRASEVMCILPFFMPFTAIGLFVGCAIANLLSSVGILDIVFGSLATLLAGLCTARIGRSYQQTGEMPNIWNCVAACAMPVVFNGPIIGALLAYTFTPDAFLEGFLLMGAQVAFGEAVVLFVLGLPLMRYLPKLRIFRELIGKH